ncbi:helix-turn-helix domain-containing protein [Dyella amyloliquefaciens]|uniref:helix-turn-helix domain-containing protein n=1 Tax=Dyella amyloliquefaciens TaxID=1770545 RepID=UPI0013EEB36E|nr:helix-turn-helix transcriptional regulator [Dyella amyloliquefaciens]
MNTFGARLRAARIAADLTQQRLGDAIGVSKGAVSRWESDQDQPQFAMLEPLRKALRVSLDELICGDSHKKRIAGVSDAHGPSYDQPDESEWRVIRAMRRMDQAQRAGFVTFVDPEGAK